MPGEGGLLQEPHGEGAAPALVPGTAVRAEERPREPVGLLGPHPGDAQQLPRVGAEPVVRALAEHGKTAEPGVDTWETTNLLCVARVLVAAALRREETRGCHWREDHADRDDEAWGRHIVIRLNPDRTLAIRTTDNARFPSTQEQ
ncbi:putative L-aspartate oxidase [Streptomyces aurantiacus JA 4570]|uniref:Putative L-aspartate oxidase n=1 Tax=Streptomyces aurantiacus JA 4570 TaxID=1286094 RepID=S3ZMX0_9ACTN|nr:putative L-aspartate oxidase [Streptomyces aurantiacus JA 4570]